jgi:hypothetical protein
MKKINIFINVAMLILICAGIVFGGWSDNQYLDPNELCASDRIQTFLMVITFYWFGANLLFKPYPFIKQILGANWQEIRSVGLLLLFMSMLGLGQWLYSFPNCRP